MASESRARLSKAEAAEPSGWSRTAQRPLTAELDGSCRARPDATTRSRPAAVHRNNAGTVKMRREIDLTRVGIAVTLIASLLVVAVIVGRVWNHGVVVTQMNPFTEVSHSLIVAFLVYGSLVYQLSRLAYFKRLQRHRGASDDELLHVYRLPHAPRVTVLVPAYKEEAEVVRKTLLSAAFQRYPNRRIVLLIDDPPQPTNPSDLASLAAMRHLPGEVEELLREPRRRCRAAFAAFGERQAKARLDLTQELRRLTGLYRDIAAWFSARAAQHPIANHVDELFVELIYRGQARACIERSMEFARGPASRRLAPDDLVVAYRWLSSMFDAEVSSFERKLYGNLSHAPNKAMNLNSYLGLMGRSLCERRTPDGQAALEDCEPASAQLWVPDADYVLMVDADSLLDPEYTVRLIHLMEQPGHERTAVAQTPYNAFPNATGVLERTAGATTDIQYIIHQGFTHYGATFWVGANALARKRALEDIAVDEVERGHPIRKFIQDRTIIEDTESSVDLVARGWQLYNYPARLAFSATPPDFGSLAIQRRRWANGGLIILPKLMRYLHHRASHGRWLTEGLMRCHYLTSLAVANVGLLVILAIPMGDGLETVWLPLTAAPYYALYARDLRQSGYLARDVLRVYALNLMLIPVHLSGVWRSLHQAWTGRKAAFGRTPKTPGHTRAPRAYVVAEYLLLVVWLLGAAVELLRDHRLHAAFALANAVFLSYALVRFIGFSETSPATAPPSHDADLRSDHHLDGRAPVKV